MITLYKTVLGKVHSSEFPSRNVPALLKSGWSKTAPVVKKAKTKQPEGGSKNV